MAYDFHRGIDIPAPEGSDVLAIAAGEVTRAGDDPSYSDRIVQIEHCKDDYCYYSNYIHLQEACVEVGDLVEPGDVVGLSGIGDSGFPHLHFEIREFRSRQENAVHPLRRLPGLGWAPPRVAILAVEDEDPAAVAVEVEVGTIGMDPALVRVEIATSDRATGEALEERVFDVEAWNQAYTLPEDPGLIDTPEIDGIRVDPAPFSEDSVAYGLRVRFSGLAPAGQAGDLAVTARAIDAYGSADEIAGP